ncbi:MAG: RNA methyltransferase [Blastomonas sp.]
MGDHRREITGFSNPVVKAARALREKKLRRREGRFLAEGLRLLTEAREAGVLPVQLFMASGRDPHPLADILEQEVLANGGTVFETSSDILGKISGKENPQALVGIFDDLSLDLGRLDRSSAPIWLVAQSLRDPGNLGTMLRTGDAVGAGGLILIDQCVDPFSVEAVRASMGAIFTQQIAHASWDRFLSWLREGPGELVGTSLNTDMDYQQLRYGAPSFILVGNEAQGLPADYEAACDHLVKMPMRGKADSLNAAIACAVMAYEVLNQQRRA